MNKKLLALVTLILGLLVIGFVFWNNSSGPVSSDETEMSFVVPKGKTASQIGNLLFEKELIKNPLAFKFYVQLTGKAKNIQAGQYVLSENLSLPEVVVVLTGQPAQVWVTIPEGLRREEISDRAIEALNLTGIEAQEFETEFLALTKGREGYVYPDTYLFPRTVDANLVASTLLNTFDTKTSETLSNSKYSTGDTIIMASILERETITDEERPIVAGILFKRLNNDWPLQADATVQYVVADFKNKEYWPILTKADIGFSSPFNTYKYTGLPPGPISNPGLSSIKAAANPQASEYWFYIHDPDGQIHYARTVEEHNSNIAKYLGK